MGMEKKSFVAKGKISSPEAHLWGLEGWVCSHQSHWNTTHDTHTATSPTDQSSHQTKEPAYEGKHHP